LRGKLSEVRQNPA